MKKNTSASLDEQALALEEAYRRGYHHGLARQRELLLRLLNEGIPARAALELCRVFEEETIIPWRTSAASTSSAPPLFDLEECQRRLQADKQRKTTEEPL